MSKAIRRADIVINFPKNGKVVNKDGSVAGYFVDAQYAQQMITSTAAGHIKTNPHLYTDWAHDKNNKAFMNHRQFLPIDVAKNVMKAAHAKNAVMYKSKNYDENLHYNFVDTSSAVKNVNNFKATTVLVNAGIDNILGDNRVLINKYDDFKPAQNLNGIDAKSVLTCQDDLTRLAQRKIGIGYSSDQDKNLKTQRYDMMQLAHHLNKKYGVRDKGEVQPDTIIEISKSGDSPNSYNLKMFKTRELDENDFDYASHTVKTQMPVTQNGMIKAPASMIAERNDMNTLETYNCLADFYHNGEFNMDAGTAQSYFEPVAESLNKKFHPFPNKESMQSVRNMMARTNDDLRELQQRCKENNYNLDIQYMNPDTQTNQELKYRQDEDKTTNPLYMSNEAAHNLNSHGYMWKMDKDVLDSNMSVRRETIGQGVGNPSDVLAALEKIVKQNPDAIDHDLNLMKELDLATCDCAEINKQNECMKNPYYVDRENSYTKLQHSLDTTDKSNEKDDGLQF